MGNCWSGPGSSIRPSNTYKVAIEPRRANTEELNRVSVIKGPIKYRSKSNSAKESANNEPDVKLGWVEDGTERIISNGGTSVVPESVVEDMGEGIQTTKATSIESPIGLDSFDGSTSKMLRQDTSDSVSTASMSSYRMSYPVTLGPDKSDSMRNELGSRGDTIERMANNSPGTPRGETPESLHVEATLRMRTDTGSTGDGSMENIFAKARLGTASMVPLRGSVEILDKLEETFWIPDSLAGHMGYDSSKTSPFMNKPSISVNDQIIHEEDEPENSEDNDDTPEISTKEKAGTNFGMKEKDYLDSRELSPQTSNEESDLLSSFDKDEDTLQDIFSRKRCCTFTSEDLVTIGGLSEEEMSISDASSPRVYTVNDVNNDMTVLSVDPKSVVTEVNALTGEVDSITVQIYKEYSRERLDQIDDEDQMITKGQNCKNSKSNRNKDVTDEMKEHPESPESIDEENNIKSSNNTVGKQACQDCDLFIKEGDAKVFVKPIDINSVSNNNDKLSDIEIEEYDHNQASGDSPDLVSTCVSYDEHHHKSSIEVYIPDRKINNPETDQNNDSGTTYM